MERIVLGVDPGSGRMALEWVIRRSLSKPTHVQLVRAFDLVLAEPDDEEAILRDAAAQLRRRSPTTVVDESLVTVAIPAALLEASTEADLLVLGSRRGRPAAWRLGVSLPLQVAARSKCATVIVPEDWTPSMRRTVVVGISGDHTCDRAMLFAAREAQDAGVELEAVHAWTVTVPDMHDSRIAMNEGDERVLHRDILSRSLERIRAAFPRVRLRGLLEQRLPSAVLAEHAIRGQLLVLGSHRWGPVTGVVLGSTARAVLPVASAPLCIVPPAAPTSGSVEPQRDAVSA
ncbi:universal stress protein [Pseudolysinimonas kribbensis]|uniref:Universal stress protein n=1 Tax=Pseudolysinimonas kribbensis TaxID=433641 RepID=A0ABQ6K8G0_9MICO|nr:universal stress protein [Pseudolysinimonas kribbensis]GMA96928.1 universal stress protein [Pseudolysinimonas kribbensis]